ncbi:CobW/P47K family protein [Eubacterium nodatum ATCC 33099]|nr:CobW/P47K family protein [Eubacterium nodatum ATCC 33099]
MTKVDIFSGFLGAGKTTLIKKLIEDGAYGEEKIVLIENEFGEIGVDGGFLKDTGIEINQMDSGCICCSLVGDFGKALNKVIEEFSPDRILIEPSGVGKLSDVIIAVRDLHNEKICLNGFTTVVDAKKCKMYMKNFGEFFNNQVEHAGSIILSHVKGLSQEKLDACVELLRSHNKEASIVTTDWNSITGEQILETMEKKQTLSAELEHLRKEACEEEAEHNHDHHHHNHENHNHKEEHHHHDHEGCSCGHHHKHDDSSHGHHHHHNHHHADEVFDEFGVETSHKFTKEIMEDALKELMKEERAGMVLRAKGIVECDNGEWIHFDYVPGEPEVRIGAAATTGMICVIGTGLKKDVIKEIFGL